MLRCCPRCCLDVERDGHRPAVDRASAGFGLATFAVVLTDDCTAGAAFPGAVAVLPSCDGLDAARLLRRIRRA